MILKIKETFPPKNKYLRKFTNREKSFTLVHGLGD
jgi:hypothetical protein